MAKNAVKKHRGKIQGIKKGTASSNADRIQKNSSQRTKSKINILNMYKWGGKAIRDRDGKIIREAQYQSKLSSGTQARVEPNRKWFGNTRVIGQESLQKFQKELGAAIKDPFKVVLKTSKLPLSLLDAKPMAGREKIHILDTESYKETFSKVCNIFIDLSEYNVTLILESKTEKTKYLSRNFK